jgi:hypothetical protein
MTTFKILAAAAFIAISAPAFAQSSENASNLLAFAAKNHATVMIEGRNSFKPDLNQSSENTSKALEFATKRQNTGPVEGRNSFPQMTPDTQSGR